MNGMRKEPCDTQQERFQLLVDIDFWTLVVKQEKSAHKDSNTTDNQDDVSKPYQAVLDEH